MTHMHQRICFGLLTFALVGCSKDDDSSETPATAATDTVVASEVVAAAKDKINDSLIMAPGMTSLHSHGLLNTAWTTASLSNEAGEDCDAMSTPKGHIQELQDDTCTISPIFDLNNLFDVLCAVTNSVEADATGLPKAGTSTPTVTAAIATECGIPDAEGFEMPTTVEDVADNDNYQKKIEVTTASDRTIYMGKNGDVVNLSFMYGDSSTYRGFYSYDPATKEMQFELQAHNDSANQMTFFRIFRNEEETIPEVKMVGSFHDQGSSKNVRWTLYGAASGDSKIAIEMAWKGQTSGTDLKTCIDRADYSADGTSSTCDDFSAPAVASFQTLMDSIVSSFGGKTTAEYEATFDADDLVNFNDETIQSATHVN
ncbi:hypothetical protein [Oligoflexus tunisiensis]|uniref:hypothetical protein n=1 Tax=Oligoflexus tunisiensis TaxID=708132 RepID=UPI000A85BAFF|nr:hypothetical protein [Oligoflexus tunisiensis]